MPLAFSTNGNTLVTVDGAELGLTSEPVQISIALRHNDVPIQTFGGAMGTPGEVQQMMADATISMALVYYDNSVLQAALTKSIGGGSQGVMPIAGTFMGQGNKFCVLNLSSPVAGTPWTFPSAYLTGNPITIPIGNEATIAVVTWRAIPYSSNPRTAAGAVLFTN